MDPNRVLLWMILLSVPVNLWRLLRSPADGVRGWIAVTLIVFAMTLACLFVAPEKAGFAGGAAWALLVFLPSFGGRWNQRFTLKQQDAKAWTQPAPDRV